MNFTLLLLLLIIIFITANTITTIIITSTKTINIPTLINIMIEFSTLLWQMM